MNHVKITNIYVLRWFSRNSFVLEQNQSRHRKALEMEVEWKNFSWKLVQIFPWKTWEKACKNHKHLRFMMIFLGLFVLEQNQSHHRKALERGVFWKKKSSFIQLEFFVVSLKTSQKLQFLVISIFFYYNITKVWWSIMMVLEFITKNWQINNNKKIKNINKK